MWAIEQTTPGELTPENQESAYGSAAAGLAAAALLAACGGGGAGDAAGGVAVVVAAGAGSVYKAPASDEDAARFLLQAQFSASDAEVAAVRGQGYAPWLAAQLHSPAAQSGVEWLNSRGYASIDASTGFFDQP